MSNVAPPPSSALPAAAPRPFRRLERQDWVAIGVLVLLVLVTRLPFRTEFLYNWDAANFALGMREFDVALHQPHPPGYPYVVLTARTIQAVTGDANTALVVALILAQAMSAVVLYLFGSALFSRAAGLAAALLLTLSVTFWSHGEIALAYPALALFSALTAYFAYQALFLGRPTLVLCAASYAVGAGFRPDLALFLLPLLPAAAWRQPPGRIIIAAGVAVGGIALWLVPTALLSGGAGNYIAALTSYFGTDVIDRYAPSVHGAEALYVNLYDTAAYMFSALYAEALIVVTGGLLFLWQGWRQRGDTLGKLIFLAGWCAPMLLFYIFVHIGNPGYVFSLLPAALLLGVGGWHNLLKGRDEQALVLAGSGLALVLLTNTFIFFLYDKPLTLAGIRASDRSTGAKMAYLGSLNREELLVFSYDSHRQIAYYLPDIRSNVWLNTVEHVPAEVQVAAGVRWAVFTDPSVFALVQGVPAEAVLLNDGVTWTAKLAVRPGQTITYTGSRITVSQ